MEIQFNPRSPWTGVRPRPPQVFSAREAADAPAAFVRADALSTHQKLLMLPQQRLDPLLVIHTEAEKRGLDLLSRLTLLQSLATDRIKQAVETLA